MHKFISVFVVMAVGATEVQAQVASAMTFEKMDQIIEQNDVTDLDVVPSLLPEKFRLNFILKHGREIIGPRGHLFELPQEDLGQGSTPTSPRAILFDEDTGFAISYNGGDEVCKVQKEVNSNGKTVTIATESDLDSSTNCASVGVQKNSHTLDMMGFDPNHGFELWKWDLHKEKGRNRNNSTCSGCHGPHNRPIFSMYPDWPGFYGSDNDEITSPNMVIKGADYKATVLVGKDYQKNELNDYVRFRKAAQNHPRFGPLFDKESIFKNWNYGLTEKSQSIEPIRKDKVWKFPATDFVTNINWDARPAGFATIYPWEYVYGVYPFRPSHTFTSTADISRAFHFRPGLRFNILMSRYHVLNLSRIIRSEDNESNFKKFGKFFVYNLMRCSTAPGNRIAMQKWHEAAGTALAQNQSQEIPEYKKIVDIKKGIGIVKGNPLVLDGNGFRYKKVAEKDRDQVLEYERSWLLFGLQLKDVDMRYSYDKPEYEYQIHKTEGPMKLGYFGSQSNYFNSYNDGSTTVDELMVANLLQHLIRTDEDLNAKLRQQTKSIRWSYAEHVLRDNGTLKSLDFNGKEIAENQKVDRLFFNDKNTKTITDDELQFSGLAEKYGAFSARYTLDRPFFKKMDALGMWINLPYAPEIAGDHHRAPWDTPKTKHVKPIYDAVCGGLEASLVGQLP